MHVAWEIDFEDVAGSEERPDAQSASELITDVLLNVFGSEETMTRAHVMLHVASPLHEQIISEGNAAIERGEEWAAEVGPIRVTLRP
ncbi:hypothetical protein ROS62_04485 [Streptomyces sp. DSM 41972]|uniref:Uncharacterized protein n=1 Tax=Streptomyces althioticus subsp. attaecolombicae TaxID=3075534 RepID=A0ABU3HU67_9ACTN|nr:hypothetical protein [Streptomyces sp. DSM 41972]SCE08745.1 hypothetical protein GA0115238_14566 [Streptomyces sp. di50b]SCE40147.1 hypothetical protein GA0115245_13346 [Streptomyces sp. di188]